MKNELKFWHIFLGLISLPFGMIIAGVISIPSNGIFININTGAILNILQFIIAVIFAFIIIRFTSKISNSDLGIHTKNLKTIIPLSILLALGYYFFSELSEHLFPSLQTASEQVIKSLNIGKNLTNDILLLLNIILFAPIAEEIIFRGILFQSIINNLKKLKIIPKTIILGLGATISALAFAFSHGGGGQDAQMLFFVLMGIITSIAFYKTKNIFTSIFIHGINNTIVFITIISTSVRLSSYHGMILFTLSIICLLLYIPITKLFGKILHKN